MAAAAPFIMIGLTAISTAVTVISAISAGRAAQQQATTNAAVLNKQADLEEQQGVTAADRQRRQGLIDRGKSIAALAGAGVDPFAGSPLDLLDQQARENEFQAEQLKFQHDERAWQMRTGAIVQQEAGDAAAARATGAAIGAGLGGGAKLAGQLDLLGKGDKGDGSSPAGAAAPPGAVAAGAEA